MLLPVSITKHPYFHEDFDETKSREFLSNSAEKANLLFCKAQNNKEFLLCYKASFRGNYEIRILKLSYNFNQKRIESSSLGHLPTLYAAGQQLPKFLKGFADKKFIPLPAYKESKLKKVFSTQLELSTPLLGNLDDNIMQNFIFSKLDIKSLYNAMQVSKIWYLLIQRNIPIILEQYDRAGKMKSEKHKKMVNSIFQFIEKELKPDSEGEGDRSKKIRCNGFKLSEPQWYGDRILCRIDDVGMEKRYLLIGSNYIRWMGIDQPVSDELYEKLLNVCTLNDKSHIRHLNEKNKIS